MLELSKTPGLTQQRLVRSLNLRKSTVSGIVAKLERRGWVQRRRSTEDRRAMNVSLTTQGERIAAELAAARQAKMDGVLKSIPEDQRATVMRALRTLIEAIHEHES